MIAVTAGCDRKDYGKGPHSLRGWACGPGLQALVFTGCFDTVGAPLLRFLQGRVRCCLCHEIFDEAKPGAASRIEPTLRKKREELIG